MTHDTTFHVAIHAALKAISQILERALHDVQEATDYIAHQEQNTAVGTIVGLDDSLDKAMSLYKAIVAMHRLDR